jgi:hypothetical protein
MSLRMVQDAPTPNSTHSRVLGYQSDFPWWHLAVMAVRPASSIPKPAGDSEVLIGVHELL